MFVLHFQSFSPPVPPVQMSVDAGLYRTLPKMGIANNLATATLPLQLKLWNYGQFFMSEKGYITPKPPNRLNLLLPRALLVSESIQ